MARQWIVFSGGNGKRCAGIYVERAQQAAPPTIARFLTAEKLRCTEEMLRAAMICRPLFLD